MPDEVIDWAEELVSLANASNWPAVIETCQRALKSNLTPAQESKVRSYFGAALSATATTTAGITEAEAELSRSVGLARTVTSATDDNGSTIDLIVNLCRLGNFYLARSRIMNAQAAFDEAYSLTKRLTENKDYYESTCLMGIASIWLREGEFSGAYVPLYDAYMIWRRKNDNIGLNLLELSEYARVLDLLATSQIGTDQFEEAAATLEEMVSLVTQIFGSSGEFRHKLWLDECTARLNSLRANLSISSSAATGDEQAIREAADPDHVKMLDDGPDAWNTWRADNPTIIPQLAGTDFTGLRIETNRTFIVYNPVETSNTVFPDIHGPDFSRYNFSRAVLKGAILRGVNLSLADLRGANLIGADLSGAHLECAMANALSDDGDHDITTFESAKMHRANFTGAQLYRAMFFAADLRQAILVDAGLKRANFATANLTNANLSQADLEGANLNQARIRGATFQKTTVRDTWFEDVEYDPRAMRGHYRAIHAASEIKANPIFMRDALDQSYIDATFNQLFLEFRTTSRHRLLRPVLALLSGIPKLENVLGAFLAVAVLWAIYPKSSMDAYAATFCAGGALSAVMASWYGRMLTFAAWSLFRNGRDWSRVMVFAIFAIGLFGYLYSILSPTHVRFVGSEFGGFVYPWYAAAMGFCTLGINNYVSPVTTLGALVMFGNVLAGFLTLGLLLSVLSNSFARRS